MFSSIFNLIAALAALTSCFFGNPADINGWCIASGTAWSISGVLALL